MKLEEPESGRDCSSWTTHLHSLASTALRTAGAGAWTASVSPSRHHSNESRIHTRMAESRIGIAAAHHPAARLAVTAQTRAVRKQNTYGGMPRLRGS